MQGNRALQQPSTALHPTQQTLESRPTTGPSSIRFATVNCVRHARPGGSRGSIRPSAGCWSGFCANTGTDPAVGRRHDQVGADEQWCCVDRPVAPYQRPRRPARFSRSSSAVCDLVRRGLEGEGCILKVDFGKPFGAGFRSCKMHGSEFSNDAKIP